MRSLKDNQSLTPVQVDANFPDGAIIDETVSQAGTAVVREIYNDILVNMYKLLRVTGTQTNGQEDSEATTYQIIGALQKLTNVQNDIEQTLSLISSTWSLNLAIDLLPNKYFLFAKAVGSYGAGPYTIKGSNSTPSYIFTSPTGFNDGDELLIILDTSGASAYSFNGGGSFPAIIKKASDIVGSDPFYAINLSNTSIPKMPKYFTMYIDLDGTGKNINLIQPVQYNAANKVLSGMNSPTDYPNQIIYIYTA